MNVLGRVLFSALALPLAGVCAGQTANGGPPAGTVAGLFKFQAVAGRSGKNQDPPEIARAAGDGVVRMDTLRVNEVKFPKAAELKVAATKCGLLEPCALVKVDVHERRRLDLFLAPVALSNGAAGFGILRISW